MIDVVNNEIDINVDAAAAERAMSEELPDAIDDGVQRAIRQLSVLAESAIKKHAPEGAGRDRHLRDTVDTRFSRGGLRANIGPRKRVGDENILLAAILADDPSWDADDPPPLGPLREWTAAKWGDGSVAAAARLQQSLVEDGMESAPNPFVKEAYDEWKTQVEDIAGREVRDSLSRLQGVS